MPGRSHRLTDFPDGIPGLLRPSLAPARIGRQAELPKLRPRDSMLASTSAFPSTHHGDKVRHLQGMWLDRSQSSFFSNQPTFSRHYSGNTQRGYGFMPGRLSSADTLQHLQALFGEGTFSGLTDGELMRRCTSAGDDSAAAALTVLVGRHGPMVLRVWDPVVGRGH
jgi:hypothetical protein